MTQGVTSQLDTLKGSIVITAAVLVFVRPVQGQIETYIKRFVDDHNNCVVLAKNGRNSFEKEVGLDLCNAAKAMVSQAKTDATLAAICRQLDDKNRAAIGLVR